MQPQPQSGSKRDEGRQARTEEALRLSEARLRAVLESAVDAIITIDHYGVVQSVNRATERMFGYSALEIIGQNISMLMPSPYREQHDGYLARYLRTGEKHIIGIGREVEGRRKDGSVFAVDLAVSEVEPGCLFTGIIRDISDRKIAEARVREADRMASIGTLAAGLGHDMNNVLLPVRAHLNALKADADAAPHRREHVEKIQKGVAYLQQLADGLHFLAMDPETVEDAEGTTNLALWWEQTGALLSKAVPKHVKVTTSIPNDLPDVAIAAHALTQAVLNLVVNAGEAIPEDRKRPQGSVRIWAERELDGSMVRLGVTDNGAGMTDEVKRRAFDMFFTTKPRGLGTGLGLALVRRVVDRAGAAVQVDSVFGKGTTVLLRLPIIELNEHDGRAPGVAISIRDGRSASMLRSILETAGAIVFDDAHDPNVQIWMMDPAAVSVVASKKWLAEHSGRQLVLFGKPDGQSIAAWRALDPLTIEHPYDLDEVRSAVNRVLSSR